MMNSELLSSFCDMLTKWAGDHPKFLCAHNGKEFDFPYLCRRMIILDICIPSLTFNQREEALGSWSSRHHGNVEIR